MDEKQNEAITSALNELAFRKGYLEENLKLTHELKVSYYFESPTFAVFHCIKNSLVCNATSRLNYKMNRAN